jgi:hypothetical protein
MDILVTTFQHCFYYKRLFLASLLLSSTFGYAQDNSLEHLRFEGSVLDDSPVVAEEIVTRAESVDYLDVYAEATNVYITNWYAVYFGRQEFVPYSELSVDAVALYIEAWSADLVTLDAGGEAIELSLLQDDEVIATGSSTHTTQTGWVYIDLDNNVILQPDMLYAIEFHVSDGSYTYDGIHLGASETSVGGTWLGNAFGDIIRPNTSDIPFKLAQMNSYEFSKFSLNRLVVSLHEDPLSDEVMLVGDFVLVADGDGINPITELITLSVGDATLEIPAYHFIENKPGSYRFVGEIDDMDVNLSIENTDFNAYILRAKVRGITLSGLSHQLRVKLAIGNDQATVDTSLKGTLRLAEEVDNKAK